MNNDIRAILVHLSMNMWEDCQPAHFKKDYLLERMYHNHLQVDEKCWDTTVQTMADNNINMVVLDLGDGIVYKSHPELAVNNAWSRNKLKNEIKRLADYGIEAIPKLNFSTCHDTWMGVYSRMVSSPAYYQCCKDLIDEVTELFQSPRFFHIGMDEEKFDEQVFYNYQTVRSGELWWDDLNFYFEQVKNNDIRPWMWSDVLRNCDEKKFASRVPLDVLQSNWYYGDKFNGLEPDSIPYKAIDIYSILDRIGYEQVPTGSNWNNDKNFSLTVEYCKKKINKDKLLGFMNCSWYPTMDAYSSRIIDSIKQFPKI